MSDGESWILNEQFILIFMNYLNCITESVLLSQLVKLSEITAPASYGFVVKSQHKRKLS